jgi:hypothetical protein
VTDAAGASPGENSAPRASRNLSSNNAKRRARITFVALLSLFSNGGLWSRSTRVENPSPGQRCAAAADFAQGCCKKSKPLLRAMS